MARVIDKSTDRVGRQFLAKIRTKQGIEWFDVLECGIKPLVVGRRSENHWHSIVDGGHEVIRCGGDNRTGFEWLSVNRLPVFPQSREGERLFTP